MKFRKRFGLLLISILALSISNVVAFTNTTGIDNNEETQSSESIIINDSATILLSAHQNVLGIQLPFRG